MSFLIQRSFSLESILQESIFLLCSSGALTCSACSAPAPWPGCLRLASPGWGSVGAAACRAPWVLDEGSWQSPRLLQDSPQTRLHLSAEAKLLFQQQPLLTVPEVKFSLIFVFRRQSDQLQKTGIGDVTFGYL